MFVSDGPAVLEAWRLDCGCCAAVAAAEAPRMMAREAVQVRPPQLAVQTVQTLTAGQLAVCGPAGRPAEAAAYLQGPVPRPQPSSAA